MNEALLNFIEKDITTKEGKELAQETLVFMREKLKDFQESTGHIYNLEATPGEGTSYRFAKIDKEQFPDIVSAGKDVPYYTNSTQLPVSYTQDVFEALELQDDLQSLYTGGTVLHGFMGERISDVETCKDLVKKIAYNFKLPYFTITPTFSICPDHGYIPGRHDTCPYDVSESESKEKNVDEVKNPTTRTNDVIKKTSVEVEAKN
jgi:ribonucleoside-triphosphate reductase